METHEAQVARRLQELRGHISDLNDSYYRDGIVSEVEGDFEALKSFAQENGVPFEVDLDELLDEVGAYNEGDESSSSEEYDDSSDNTYEGDDEAADEYVGSDDYESSDEN